MNIKKITYSSNNDFKALNADPCEDAVSREAVLNYIRDNYRRWFINDDAFMQCVNGIKNIVPVTPKPTECEDCVSREFMYKLGAECIAARNENGVLVAIASIESLPPVTPKQRWIPVSERLPEDLEPVNITWVNHDPESYYMDIKDKPFTATGVYFNGQWYWWSTLCTDVLAEYSHNYNDIIDDAIEVTAWMHLPESYKEGESE